MSDHKSATPSDNLNKAVEEILHHLTNQAYYSDADYAEATQALLEIINNEKIEAVKDALTKSEEAKQPSVSKPLTLDRLKNLVGRNLRKNEPDYGRRQFVMGYNQAKDEIRERILTW